LDVDCSRLCDKACGCLKAPSKTLQPLGIILNCKNRVQVKPETEVTAGKEGCSVNRWQAAWVNIKEMRFPWGIITGKTPIMDFNNPFNDPNLAFGGSCNTHDWCYGKCQQTANDSADRLKCDNQLRENLRRVCEKAKDQVTMNECLELTGDMYGGLRLWIVGGAADYAAAQIQYCKCDLCP
jgi:hypothetical protein